MILTCSSHIQGERTISATYHLFNGRKSIQTVQDAHIYKLENFYGVYKSLTKKKFDDTVSELTKVQLLEKGLYNNLMYTITKKGSAWLNKHQSDLPLSYFDGLKSSEIANNFFDRLALLIQTITNSKNAYYTFIPVIDKTPVEDWVRMIYRNTKGAEQQLLQRLFEDLHCVLKYFTKQEASIFVDRLTGYKQYGMSIEQLANTYQQETSDIKLLLAGIQQKMVSIIQSETDQLSFLPFILRDLLTTVPITNSAYATSELVHKAYTIEQIARFRNLRESTIHDHLAEIALYDAEFPINNYVTVRTQQEIIAAVQQTNSYKLKQIKQHVNEHISYFQIRLVLVMNHNILQAGDRNA